MYCKQKKKKTHSFHVCTVSGAVVFNYLHTFNISNTKVIIFDIFIINYGVARAYDMPPKSP